MAHANYQRYLWTENTSDVRIIKCTMTRMMCMYIVRDRNLLEIFQCFQVEVGDDDDDVLGNDKSTMEDEATNKATILLKGPICLTNLYQLHTLN